MILLRPQLFTAEVFYFCTSVESIDVAKRINASGAYSEFFDFRNTGYSINVNRVNFHNY